MPKMYNTEEAAALLGVSTETLQRWRSRGIVKLPYVRVGQRRVMYLERDLLDFVEHHRQPE